ncbi:MAG: NAD-dependent epimerase/dehydratase family protein [Spirochaetaceae bacterium]|nr:MAG: NAD-dependent epimerase/dehydratase family protein [Spirochaetaceae bacterium]
MLMLKTQVDKKSGLCVVTGAAGHIGNTLVRLLLEDGGKVRACLHNDTLSLGGIGKTRIDILDHKSMSKAFKGADTVFHCAAMIAISRNHIRQMNEINIRGTENVVAACREAGVRRLVHFSSIHAISPYPEGKQVDETKPSVCSGEGMPYDYSKAMSEEAVLAGVSKGLDAVIVNPTGVIGPWDWKPSFMGNFVLSICSGKIPFLVNGGFNWVDVRDVAMGAVLAGRFGKTGQRYILGNQWISVQDLAQMLGEISQNMKKRPKVPHWLAHVGVPFFGIMSWFSKKQPLFTHDSLATLLHHRDVSWEKASRELTYSPRPIKETLADTVNWFRDNGYHD